jgi:signal peptidase I
MLPNADGTACVVPPGAVFVLGDDRWNSLDSRRFGAVPIDRLVGVVRGVWWPGEPSEGARWSRLGRVE